MNPAAPQAADGTPRAPADDTDTDNAVASSSHDSPSSLKRRKHVELLEDLLRSLDSVIYIELGALYYLDCAFGLLILRALVQLFLLTARPYGIPEPPSRSALGGILGSNILCILLHLVNARPEAGEATRAYLHGSLLIDFVGQLGPTSKWRLFSMDVLALALQVVMLGLGIEKRRIQKVEQQTPGHTQDLEAEEAGIVRSEDMRNEPHESNDGIEMQELLGERRLEDEGGQAGSNTHPLDEFYTGRPILASLNVFETISRSIASPSGEGVGDSATSGSLFVPGLGLRWRTLS
jgi:Fungal domain of unknown function (DUF1746)